MARGQCSRRQLSSLPTAFRHPNQPSLSASADAVHLVLSELQPWSKLIGTLPRKQLPRSKFLLRIQSVILRYCWSCGRPPLPRTTFASPDRYWTRGEGEGRSSQQLWSRSWLDTVLERTVWHWMVNFTSMSICKFNRVMYSCRLAESSASSAELTKYELQGKDSLGHYESDSLLDFTHPLLPSPSVYLPTWRRGQHLGKKRAPARRYYWDYHSSRQGHRWMQELSKEMRFLRCRQMQKFKGSFHSSGTSRLGQDKPYLASIPVLIS